MTWTKPGIPRGLMHKDEIRLACGIGKRALTELHKRG